MAFDVVAVNIKTSIVRVLATDKTGSNAVAFQEMAVLRLGVDEEFFAVTPHAFYADGDKWKGPHEGMPTEAIDERRGSIVRVGNTWYPDGPRGLR